METLFHLQNIKYHSILEIPDLMIPKNQVTCITGPSGSGKTTLLKLLNGFISPTCGSIYYENQSIEEIPPTLLRRKIIMVGQQSHIFMDTIEDNFKLAIDFSQSESASITKMNSILQLVSLDKNLSQSVCELSGGEKQRLALARALILCPAVLLLDEPSSALDSTTELTVIRNIIQYAKQHGITIIMITHSSIVKQTFSEYLIHISNGKLDAIQGGETA